MDLGKNSENVRYEVALEALGQSLKPLVQALHDERKKAKPSQAFIEYCQARINAVSELQDTLSPADQDTIERILNKDAVFRVQ